MTGRSKVDIIHLKQGTSFVARAIAYAKNDRGTTDCGKWTYLI